MPPVLLSAIFGLQPFVEPAYLFRDPLAAAKQAAELGQCCHAYYGALSQLGVLVWAASAVVTAFAAALLRHQKDPNNAWQFMLAAGALSTLLVVDDVFQGHEFVYIRLFGIPEVVTVAIYAVLVVAYLWVFRRMIAAAGPVLLVISLFGFAISAVSDLFVSVDTAWGSIMEDGSKLVGIFCWTAFHGWAAWSLLVQPIRADTGPAD